MIKILLGARLPSDEMNWIVNCREYIVQLEQQQEMLRRQVRGNSVEKYLNIFSSDWALSTNVAEQDETMDLMSGSVGNIRNMSEHISNELDEQAV